MSVIEKFHCITSKGFKISFVPEIYQVLNNMSKVTMATKLSDFDHSCIHTVTMAMV